jgi:hypothetical protein
LRGIEIFLASFASKLYHARIRKLTARSPLDDANEKRARRNFAGFAQAFIRQSVTL